MYCMVITFTLYLWCDRTVKNIQLIYYKMIDIDHERDY